MSVSRMVGPGRVLVGGWGSAKNTRIQEEVEGEGEEDGDRAGQPLGEHRGQTAEAHGRWRA